MNRKIRILVVTYLPWREDNNIGNSYSNIFKDTEDKYEFAHIYIRDGLPQNKLVKEYYHISEKGLMKHLWKPSTKVGKYMHIENSLNTPKDTFSSAYNRMRILRWQIFFLGRSIIGASNCWKNESFDDFFNTFKPDVIFGTLPTEPLVSNIMIYVKNRLDIPLITYPWDDYYSLNHSNLSPVFWIRKFMSRHYLRKTAANSEFLYVISDVMKHEYENIFHKECKLLFKGHHFDSPRYETVDVKFPIKMVYIGNIGGGRWKTLSALAHAAKEINDKEGKKIFQLDVYTLSPKSNEIMKGLNIEGTSRINEPVANEDVATVMGNAHILLHVEPFRKSEYQFYRASFSTKLVDYFYAARCILAVGGMTASTDYLKSRDAAICVTDPKGISETLDKIKTCPELITEYAKKSWECGVNNHQIKVIQEKMYNDIKQTIEYYGNKKS